MGREVRWGEVGMGLTKGKWLTNYEKSIRCNLMLAFKTEFKEYQAK